jgi:hypothetical protein
VGADAAVEADPDLAGAARESRRVSLRLMAAGRTRSYGHLIPVIRGHLPARDHGVMDPAPALYMIRIKGHLGATVLSAFPAMTSRRQGAETVLTGLLDRSALYGVLAESEALGLDLLEIRQLTPDRKSPELGDSCSP